ncbi:MAG: helix-turn-helix transcriptional regulator, partial [Raineya sp.]
MRYLTIDEMLRNKQRKYPSKEEIIATIQERTDKNYSDSSLEKDFKAMRSQFGAPIEFHNLYRGYFYGYKNKNKRGEMSYEEDTEYKFMSISLSQKDLIALNFAESVLQSFRDTPIFAEFSDAINKVLDAVEINKQLKDTAQERKNFVQTENAGYTEGRKWLSDILSAIKSQKQIRFAYKKFSQTQSEERILHPYLLKEFKGRWYVIGYNPEKQRTATFALDRIMSLEISSLSVMYPEKIGFEAETFYDNCFGITRLQDEKVEHIVLSFTPFWSDYLKTKPLHHTQKILVDDAQEFRISLELIINYDLLTELLSYGSSLQVLAPTRL